jgi:peptidoglycan/LPS O-acetylase OafA/YrhL
LLIQAWIPQQNNELLVYAIPGIAHSWSISVELLLYISFPLCVFAFSKIRRSGAVFLTLASYLGAFSFVVVSAVVWRQEVISLFAMKVSPRDGLLWLTYYSPYTRLFQFACGCLLAILYQSTRLDLAQRQEKIIALSLGPIATAAFIYAIYLTSKIAIDANSGALDPRSTIYVRLVSLVFVVWLIYVSCRYSGFHSRLLSNKFFVLGGEISYSIYLLHPFILKPFIKPPFEHITPASLALFALSLLTFMATVFVFAYGTYRIIETPARRWLRGKLNVSSI